MSDMSLHNIVVVGKDIEVTQISTVANFGLLRIDVNFTVLKRL